MTTTAEDILRLAHIYAIKGDYEPFRTAVESLVTERDALRHAAAELVSAALAQPEPAAPTVEPVGWLESPHGAFRANPLYRHDFPPQSVAWQIPVYATPPRAALTQVWRVGNKTSGVLCASE